MTDSFNTNNNNSRNSRIPDDIDLNEAGKEILNAVSRAVETGDFSQLNVKLNRTLGGAAKTAFNAVDSAVDSVAGAINDAAQDFTNSAQQARQQAQQARQRQTQRTTPPPTSTSFRGTRSAGSSGGNGGNGSGPRDPRSASMSGMGGETMTDRWVRTHQAQSREDIRQRQA